MSARAKVLFVDDETAVLEGLRRALRRQPFEIFTASSGGAGLQILHASEIDVVVSDERMPGMPGSEFLAAVRREYPATLRIVLTGQASLDAAIRAVNEGEVYRFLLKPCDAADLAQTIVTGLEARDLRREAARLLAAARQRGDLLRRLEAQHPGITLRERASDGSYELDLDAGDATTSQALIRGIREELDAA